MNGSSKKSPPLKAVFRFGLFTLCGIVFLLSLLRGILTPLNYDDAFNLQVVDNLSKGHGYSTYGVIRGWGPWLFDPYITTGPVALLPTAGVWWLTNGSLVAVRLVMLAFYALYFFAIIRLVPTKENAIVVGSAIAMPLMTTFSPGTVLGPTPGPPPVTLSFGPGLVLGEIPAAALLLLGASFFSRCKPILGGLFVGLTLQTKFSYSPVGYTLLAAWIYAELVAPGGGRRSYLIIASSLLATALPTLCFEFFRFVSLGSVDLYQKSIVELSQFLQGQKLNNWSDIKTLGTKVGGLYQSLEFPGWFVALFAVMGLLTTVLSLSTIGEKNYSGGTREPSETSTDYLDYQTAAHFGILSGAFIILCSWIFVAKQPSSRQGIPALLLGMPSIGFLFTSICSNNKIVNQLTRYSRKLLQTIQVLFFISLLLALSGRVISLLEDNSGLVRYREQKVLAAQIKRLNPSSISTSGWWQNPEFLFLTKIPAAPLGSSKSQLIVLQDYQFYLTGSLLENQKSRCGEIVYQSPSVLACWGPS